jgi:hypothetical protein
MDAEIQEIEEASVLNEAFDDPEIEVGMVATHAYTAPKGHPNCC